MNSSRNRTPWCPRVAECPLRLLVRVWRVSVCTPLDTLRRMETFEMLREHVLDGFETLGPIEPRDVADGLPLFRAASS